MVVARGEEGQGDDEEGQGGHVHGDGRRQMLVVSTQRTAQVSRYKEVHLKLTCYYNVTPMQLIKEK